MKYFDYFFGDASIFALAFKGRRISNMNRMASELLSGSATIVEYILDSSKFLDHFDVLLGGTLYRMIKIRMDDETLILGIDISDIKMKEYFLRKANREQEKKIEEMIAFSDLIIHDIKNYLFMMSGYLELLEEDYDPRYIGELKKILDSMKNLIARSSLFIKSPEEHRKRERLQVSSIIHRAIKALKMDLEKKKIRMVKSYGDAWIYVDPVIVEAFINILHNAIKYSPEGGEVVIETEKLEDSILIKIRDQGPGIPDEYKEVIFKRFRCDKRKFGMGLGLATAKYLVEANGGRIWVEDNIPRGSVFNIQLPRK